MGTTTNVVGDANEHGQIVTIEKDCDGERTSLRLEGTGDNATHVTMSGDGATIDFYLTAADARVIVKHLGWQYPETGVMGVMQANQALLEERRVSGLPNETLTRAALEARGIYGIIATRVFDLRKLLASSSDEAHKAALRGGIAELEMVSESLKAAVIATLPPQTTR